MRAALACAVGCERGPIAERIEIPSLRARWRSDRVEQSIAIGVRKHAPRKAGELIQIIVAVKFAQGRVQQIVLEESITRTVVTVLIPVHDCARTGDAPPDLIDNTSKPVQAGVLVACVGICGRVSRGLNVRQRRHRRGFFDDRGEPQITVALRTERGVGC